MKHKTIVPIATLKTLFAKYFSTVAIYSLLRLCGVRRRRPPVEAFHHGLRLLGGMALKFSVTNTPVVKRKSAMWLTLETSADELGTKHIQRLVRRNLKKIADDPLPKRRNRSCPRTLRQSVSSWPRLRRNTYRKGIVTYLTGEIYA